MKVIMKQCYVRNAGPTRLHLFSLLYFIYIISVSSLMIISKIYYVP